MKIRSKIGVMLFEVLIAVLVLAIGITGSLQAFSSIVQVTKRSRDLFEARFVAGSVLFDLFALPESVLDTTTGVPEEFEHDTMSFQKQYSFSNEMEEIAFPMPEEEKDVPGVERIEPVEFIYNNCVVSNQNGRLYSIESFLAIPNDD